MERLLGDRPDPRIRPVVGVMLFGTVSFSLVFSFMGIWAIEELRAGETRLGLAYAGSAVVAGLGGVLGGRVSDRVGRRPMIVCAWGLQSLVGVLAVVVDGRVWAGVTLIVLIGAFDAVGAGADQAVVADLIPADERERAYAALRVAQNLGAAMGPALGGLLLIVGWTPLFLTGSALAATATVIAWRYLPHTGGATLHGEPEGGDGALRVLARDRRFAVFFVGGTLAGMIYLAYETLLPISLTRSHGLEPAAWGFLLVINPIMVTLLQMRVTAWTRHVPVRVKLPVGVLLMGLPFLVVPLTQAIPVLVAVIVVFVVGEMLWVPSAQAVVARLAPERLRGTYLGAYGGTFAVSFALAPLAGLSVMRAYGDTAMWLGVAALACAAALVLAVVVPRADGRDEEEEAAAAPVAAGAQPPP